MFVTKRDVCGILVFAALAVACTKQPAIDDDGGGDGGFAGITGMVSAAPVNGATVAAYTLNSDGSQGQLLASGNTFHDGSYLLSFSPPSGPVVIVSTGGSYIEESDGSSVSMGKAVTRTVLPAVTNGQDVAVTPVTEIATQSVLAAISSNTSTTLVEIIAAKNAEVASAMGLTDITVPPANPSFPSAASPANATQYALVLGSISQMAKNASTANGTTINSMDITQALAVAYSYNGTFDSTVGTTDIPVPNLGNANITLASVFSSGTFDAAMGSAMSDFASSGLGAALAASTTASLPIFVTTPPIPSGMATVTLPTSPTALPSGRPTLDGPPPLMGALPASGTYTSSPFCGASHMTGLTMSTTIFGNSAVTAYTFSDGCHKTLSQKMVATASGVAIFDVATTCAGSCPTSECLATTSPSGPWNSSSSATFAWALVPNGGGFDVEAATSSKSSEFGCNSNTMNYTLTYGSIQSAPPPPPQAHVPGAPTIGTATAGAGLASVSFTAPASNGGATITGYRVTSSPGAHTATGASSPIVVTGLTNGTAYTFTVAAINSVGTGSASSASNSVTPVTVPGAPVIGVASAGDTTATVSFSAPASNGGSAITGYSVTSSPDGIVATGSSSPIAVTGLTNGTAYTFTVKATNAVGTSVASAASNSVTPQVGLTVADAPTIGTATAGNGNASVTFTAPANDGGSAITGYVVTSTPGSFTGSGSASPIVVSGLTNGTAYTFTVTAINGVGTSADSAASNSVTPAVPPRTVVDILDLAPNSSTGNFDLGAFPAGGVTLSGTTLYGTASGGGANNKGTIYRVGTDGSGATTIYDFTGGADGLAPIGNLVLSGSTLYGMTFGDGGTTSWGTIFSVNTDGTGFTTLHSFDPATDGASPAAGLTLVSGSLYGTTSNGGASGNGIIFDIMTDGSNFQVLHSFTDAANPYGKLIAATTTLYGAAFGGGANSTGYIFSIRNDGSSFTDVFDFPAGACGSSGGLVLSGTTLYGTCEVGGTNSKGFVFSVDKDGTGFTDLYDFSGGADGANPWGTLILDGSSLYGITITSDNSTGALFKVDTDGTNMTTLYDFPSDTSMGTEPEPDIIIDGSGVIFGTMNKDAPGGGGNIFKY